VVILSRNDPVSGMRVFRSCQHYGLPIERGVFTRGRARGATCKPLAANLFLTVNEADVRRRWPPACRRRGCSRIGPRLGRHPGEVRIAFDGDAVLFSDEAERVFQREGLEAFQSPRARPRRAAAGAGPVQAAAGSLAPAAARAFGDMRVRTALVTARSAPAHERAIRTLMDWQIDVDEAMFLGGLPKGEFLREFEPDFFFDDQTGHVDNARACGTCRPRAAPPVHAHAAVLDTDPASGSRVSA
jgi:5'-nucleotidase